MDRRKFLQKSALTSVGSLMVPAFLKAWEQYPLAALAADFRRLVIIQFSGGNDGLNTVVPYRNDVYYKERPRLAIEAGKVLNLSDELGLNPQMLGLKKLYDEGFVSVLNNVGYPNPDRSHFRSMDIWHTASNSDEYLSTGWLGRYLDANCEGSCASAHHLIEVDDMLSLASKGEYVKGLALQNPDKLQKSTQGRGLQLLKQQAEDYHEEEPAAYLYKTLAETVSSAEYLYEKSKVYRSKETYPNHALGRQLKTIAELINSGVDSRVYYASVSGFDTHVNQKPAQDRLLGFYSNSLEAFVKDLKKNQQFNNTLILTFSEFGRRVKQNASNGTDHGTANNVFIIGGKLAQAGVYNEGPNLQDLDNGDLKYSLDFRKVYATLLEGHLKADSQKILGRKFDTLKFI